MSNVTSVIPVEVECRGVAVERVSGVGVCQQLRQETAERNSKTCNLEEGIGRLTGPGLVDLSPLEDIGEVVERRPRLVDDVQAHRAGDLVYVRVVHLKGASGKSI